MHPGYLVPLQRLAFLFMVVLLLPITPIVSMEEGKTYRPCQVAVAASNFSGRWAVYLLWPYEGKVIELSAPGVEDRQPTWSPDGRQIAFERREGDNWNIYVLKLTTGAMRKLTGHPAFDGYPNWSPDGKSLVFESSRDGTLGIYAVPATGGVVRKVFVGDVASTSPVWQAQPNALLISSWSKGRQGLFTLRPGASTPIEVDQHEDLGQSVVAGESIASSVVVGDEAHILVRTGQGAQLDLSRAGQHHEWPTWDQTIQRWAALELVGGNRYEYPHGWRIVILGQDSTALPLFLPGQWQRLGCAPNPTAISDAYASRMPSSAMNLRAVGTMPPVTGKEELTRVPNLEATQPWFVQSVAPSFISLRAALQQASGYDALRALNDVWRDLGTDSGATFSWHKAGRAFDMQFTLSDRADQPLLFISRETLCGETYFRLYIRTTRQDGSQGEPLRQSLWVVDFDRLDQAGRPTGGRSYAPNDGYFVDFTDLAQRHGWLRISAATRPDLDWRSNFHALEYWHYERKDGLCLYAALGRLYPDERIRELMNYDRLLADGRTPQELSYFCVPKPTRT